MIKWSKLVDNQVQANCDATVDEKLKKTSLGAIVRDVVGEIMASLSSNINYYLKPTIVAAMAIRKSKDLGFANVIFEGDSQGVVNTTNINKDIRTDYGAKIHYIRRMMSERSS